MDMIFKHNWWKERISSVIHNLLKKKLDIDADIEIKEFSIKTGDDDLKTRIHIEADGTLTKDELDKLIFIKILGL